jgi:hemoglobin
MRTDTTELGDARRRVQQLLRDAPGADQPFQQPWELRAFAMAVAAHHEGHYEWSEFQLSLIESIRGWESVAGQEPWSYYQHWLEALENVLAASGALSDSVALEERTRTVLATPRNANHHEAHREPVAIAPARGTDGETMAEAPAHTPTDQTASLYERLGGYDAIYAFASTVLKRAMQDETIGRYWDHATEASLYEEHINFVDFLCAHWGGETRYRGKEMVKAHRGMGITEEDWAALFDVVMEKCYDEYDLAPELRVEVTAFLQKFKPVVVGSPTYRSVVLANPDMDITKGMKSVGVVWPPRRPAVADAQSG